MLAGLERSEGQSGEVVHVAAATSSPKPPYYGMLMVFVSTGISPYAKRCVIILKDSYDTSSSVF